MKIRLSKIAKKSNVKLLDKKKSNQLKGGDAGSNQGEQPIDGLYWEYWYDEA